MGATWIGINRFRMRLENTWPLLFYLGLVFYLNTYDRVLNPYVVYVAVVCALFVRFEFMNERVVFFVRFVEVAALVQIGYCLLMTLLKAY
ncbi:hypothetical protein [uncultured Paludibaculum sp.]|uniref:hypothetical protein n=1 Tax=uncultured Paludibaculum sp. TaxID=1765020 RepID=UPI002AAACBAB|nr:hypothetical protein [uncultured Paludibaculum sp.]